MLLSPLKSFLQHNLHANIQRFVVAYSGGVDSQVLLHALVSLQEMHQKPIVMVHVHHGLSPFADDWATHAEHTAQHYGITCIVKKVIVAKTASLESAAREARYQAFQSVLIAGDVLLLAHHQNDQAETLLLRLLRGSGVRGLAAMQDVAVVPFQTLDIPCWRPLLNVNRQTIEQYAQQHGLDWINDDSNSNIQLNRNYLRHLVLPVLQQRWPSVSQQLADTSQRMREADELLNTLAAMDYQQAQLADKTLNIDVIHTLTVARRNNLLRYWLQQQQLALPDYDDLIRVWTEVCLAQQDAEPLLAWRGVEVRRYRNQLFAMKPLEPLSEPREIIWSDKNKPLLLPTGEFLTPIHAFVGINEALWQNGQVSIRYRQGGEKIQPIGRHHHHDLKKLLQAQGVPSWQRSRIPLLYINQQLAAVLGYWIAHEFAA